MITIHPSSLFYLGKLTISTSNLPFGKNRKPPRIFPPEKNSGKREINPDIKYRLEWLSGDDWIRGVVCLFFSNDQFHRLSSGASAVQVYALQNSVPSIHPLAHLNPLPDSLNPL